MSRLNKSLSEKIYLLSANQETKERWSFKVRGQSKNIYEQVLQPDFYVCSCPDHQKKHTFCKHLLFLISRVAIQLDIASKISLDNTKWSQTYFKACSLSLTTRLKSRFEESKKKLKDKSKVNEDISKVIGTDCPICFEEMKENEVLSQCVITCKNYFHKKFCVINKYIYICIYANIPSLFRLPRKF